MSRQVRCFLFLASYAQDVCALYLCTSIRTKRALLYCVVMFCRLPGTPGAPTSSLTLWEGDPQQADTYCGCIVTLEARPESSACITFQPSSAYSRSTIFIVLLFGGHRPKVISRTADCLHCGTT